MSEIILPEGPMTQSQLASLDGELRGAGLPVNATSVVLANSLRIKAGPGTLYGLTITNTNAASQQILLFDIQVSTTVAEGTVPAIPITVAGSSTVGVYFGPMGRFFANGIFVCNSSTVAMKTIGAADCWFDAQFV
jgi:hypothetical protein